MLLSGWVASRIGAKRTLLSGLVLIIVFSALAGLSNSVGAIVGLRAGWGLGNALFIATALSVIVGSASGGVAGAVMLYEAALGFGISLGPLLGGELGGISWRGPFLGVAVLMAIGFVAIRFFLPATPPPPVSERISILEPLRALKHRATRGSGLTAVFYNFGFFTLLGYAPFPLHLGVHQLGYTFTGWGLLLALFAVFVAPRVSRRFGDVRALAGIVAVLVVMGVLHASQTALIVCVVASGMFFGVTNTLMTQVVMESAPVARPIASSAYSFVRFCGGAIAPFLAGKLGEHVSVQAPFYLGAAMTGIAIGVLWFYRASLVPVVEPDATAEAEPGVLVVAVAGPGAVELSALAGRLARDRGQPVHVLHVIESDVLGDEVAELEPAEQAAELVAASVARVREAGVPVTGEILRSYGTHADVASRILARAAQLRAAAIVTGPESRHGPLSAGVTAEIAARSGCHVIVLHPESAPLTPGLRSVR
jgi:ACDE family multidrug resistance protein